MLLEPCTKGDPETPLHYTSTSIRNREKVLGEQGYSLQANRKEQAWAKSHPDRNAQFEYINQKARAHTRRCEAVRSINAKKKEYQGKGAAPLVYDHDVLWKATPLGGV